MENAYHSPEESKEDPDNLSNNRDNCIIIRDLKWKSSSVSLIVIFFLFFTNSIKLCIFLRDYVDKLYYQYKSDKRRRKQMHDDTEYTSNETAAPLNASCWTKSDYNRTILNLIIEAVRKDEHDEF